MDISEELAQKMVDEYKTSWTHNKEFDKVGAIVLRNVVDGSTLARPKPDKTALYNYKKHQLVVDETGSNQVQGSIETYNYPDYREYHTHTVRLIIEKAIGRKLYPTYYLDRFYLRNQKLDPHMDREACEISASMLISTTLDEPWPLIVVHPTDNLENVEATPYAATDKDLIVYKGCESIHFRDNMPRGEHVHHQVFFHYVLQDGYRAYAAFDNGRRL